MSSLTQDINNKRKANNNRKEGEKLPGSVHIKKRTNKFCVLLLLNIVQQ